MKRARCIDLFAGPGGWDVAAQSLGSIPLRQRRKLVERFEANPVYRRWHMDPSFAMWEHSEWFKPYAAGYYAATYLGEELSRDEVEERMDELLGLELSVEGKGPLETESAHGPGME